MSEYTITKNLLNKSLRFFPGWDPFSPNQIIGLLNMINDILKQKIIINNLIEFGSHIGESTTLFAGFSDIKNIHCVDTWPDPQIEKHFDLRFKNIITPKIIKHKCRTKDFIYKNADMVYIDADHSYSSVKQDLILAKQLINTSGIIAGHDYHDNATGVTYALNEFIKENNYRLQTYTDSSWFILNQ